MPTSRLHHSSASPRSRDKGRAGVTGWALASAIGMLLGSPLIGAGPSTAHAAESKTNTESTAPKDSAPKSDAAKSEAPATKNEAPATKSEASASDSQAAAATASGPASTARPAGDASAKAEPSAKEAKTTSAAKSTAIAKTASSSSRVATQHAAGKTAHAAAAPSVVVTQTLAPQDERVTYQYNALGRRDPFQPLVGGGFVGGAAMEAPPDIGGMKVVGIVWGSDDKFALVEDPRGTSLVLRAGDKVMNGVVETLKRDAVVVKLSIDGQTQSVAIPLTRKGESANESD